MEPNDTGCRRALQSGGGPLEERGVLSSVPGRVGVQFVSTGLFRSIGSGVKIMRATTILALLAGFLLQGSALAQDDGACPDDLPAAHCTSDLAPEGVVSATLLPGEDAGLIVTARVRSACTHGSQLAVQSYSLSVAHPTVSGGRIRSHDGLASLHA